MPSTSRPARLALAVGAALLLPSAVAEAATTVTRTGNRVTVEAAPGVANDIRIGQSGATYTFADVADTVTPIGCVATADPHRVNCGGPLKTIVVRTGDRPDQVIKTAAVQGDIETGDDADVVQAGPTAGYPNRVEGGDGIDNLSGGPDRDWLDGGPGADVISGGGGTDRARYLGRTADLTVSLDGVANDGEAGEGDNVRTDVEDVDGSSGDDKLTGSGAANYLGGYGGDDELYGLGGNDTLSPGEGADESDGGPDNDILFSCCYADGPDVKIGGTGVDTARYYRYDVPISVSLNGLSDDGAAGEGDDVRLDVENLEGGYEADTFTGSSGANHLLGGGGDDVLDGLGGPDTLDGDDGIDNLNGSEGDDALDGGDNADRLSGGTGRDRADYDTRTAPVSVTIGTLANDGEAGEGDEVLADVEDVTGGTGGDTLRGSGVRNFLVGGGGPDDLDGLGGPDVLTGGPGDDDLLGGPGNDSLSTIDAVGGNDTLDGQGDSDTCSFDRFDPWANCEALFMP
jgi:Ca2+-binding RTX toxin-like protein